MRTFKKISIAFILLISVNIYGSSTPKKKGPPEGLGVGIGYIYSESEYVGDDSKHLPMPLISYIKGNFFLRGLNAGYSFYNNDWFRSSVLVDSKFFAGGYESDDSSALSGMDERKGTVLSGGQLNFRLWKLKLDVKVMRDILGVHGGYEGELKLRTNFPISVLFKDWPFTMVGASVGYQYNSHSYNNYYYGVKDSEVTSQRVKFITKDSWSPAFGTFVRTTLSEKWKLMTFYNLKFLSEEIRNSPIVDKNKTSTLAIFFNYQL
ncbi:MAG: MipA/OmpV family protein [Bacteriovoracaceae bacterium]|nr:MipA/OmpV family protein [Bacteriovoracaceae bacterium]